MEDDERNNEHWLLRSAQQGQDVRMEAPTLRDQFAMAALTGLLADSKLDAKWGAFAISSYEIADEMLAAREAK